MAEKKKLFTNFAKRLSNLEYSKPKIMKKVFTNKQTSRNPVNNANLSISTPSSLQNKEQNVPSNIQNMDTSDEDDNINNSSNKDPDFSFENSALKAYIEKGVHKREKKFAMHDHLYYIKVKPKNDTFPLLVNIIDFLSEACNYILEELKDNYPLKDNNIAYLTVYQSPMINGNFCGIFIPKHYVNNKKAVHLGHA